MYLKRKTLRILLILYICIKQYLFNYKLCFVHSTTLNWCERGKSEPKHFKAQNDFNKTELNVVKTNYRPSTIDCGAQQNHR